MADIGAIEKRDQELRHSLTSPTEAERDRRELLGVTKKHEEAMREAVTHLRDDETHPVDILSAIAALRYSLEQA